MIERTIERTIKRMMERTIKRKVHRLNERSSDLSNDQLIVKRKFYERQYIEYFIMNTLENEQKHVAKQYNMCCIDTISNSAALQSKATRRRIHTMPIFLALSIFCPPLCVNTAI